MPIQVGTSKKWLKVSVGVRHNCGIKQGQLYCWGENTSFQLGVGVLRGGSSNYMSEISTPQKVDDSYSWTHIAVGERHSCGIKSGTLFCWGSQLKGAVGAGKESLDSYKFPEQIGESTNWSEVSAGSEFTCGIDAGKLFCWGSNANGQIGGGSTVTVGDTEKAPLQIGLSNQWSLVSAGVEHVCAYLKDELYCWGSDRGSQLGNGEATPRYLSVPTRIDNSNEWSNVSAGYDHTCGIRNGEAFCWGAGSRGRLGLGDVGTRFFDSPKSLGQSSSWSLISGIFDHSCGLQEGKLFCWGLNSHGAVGKAVEGSYYVWDQTAIGELNEWSLVSTGLSHSCGINSGQLYCWGSDSSFQQGNGVDLVDQILVPQAISDSSLWLTVSAGASHTCAIEKTAGGSGDDLAGNLYCWGSGIRLQIGNGPSLTNVAAPELIGASSTWSQVAAGSNHTCGINDGRLFCWGYNGSRQLGFNSLNRGVDRPTQVGVSQLWTKVAVSGNASCGLKGGQLYCWGSNLLGKSGNGDIDTISLTTPTRIGVEANWTAISLGRNHSCGIRDNGLYCWGGNGSGELGMPGPYAKEPFLVAAPK